MKLRINPTLECIAICLGALLLGSSPQKAVAQDATNPPYLNPQLSPEQRATDLVRRMTLAEKATQMQNNSAAIERLKVPAYQWWSEALHGVINEGVTEYPEPVGLAATFDAPGIHTMAAQIGIEGRIKHVQNLREGHTGIMGGLDFWSPNLNIFRDPRWGRGQETYGEDPFLTGRMGVAYVTGLQGDNPKYYLGIATPKHYAVHSGPEPTRHFADVDVSKHDQVDTYEPAFRAAIVEGKAGSVMCAYNAINGEPACANQYLLQDQLRGKWGFQGYVVSDCDAVRDVAANHRYRPTQAQGAAISVIRGMDNECVTFTSRFGDPVEKAYVDAVQQGYLPESTLDTALIRLFTARIKLGMFDPPDMVPYTKIDEKELDSAEHRAHALKLANESMVLLKNDGLLPLKPGIKKIAVVGPLADQTRPLIGNYAGQPTHIVSVMEGLKAEFPNASITYVPGTQFLRTDGTPVPDGLLTTPDGKPGLKAEYNEGMRRGPGGPPSKSIATRTESNVKLTGTNLPSEVAGKKIFGVQWSGFLTPNESGDFLIGIRCQGFGRITVDTKQVAMAFGGGNEATSGVGRVHLEKGRKVAIEVSYGTRDGKAHAELIWNKANNAPSPEAVAAAKNADVVIAVVGITSQLEGEEMPVSEPGFLGGDRTSIDLPQPEEDLVEAVAATGKPLAVVLMNGSALAVNWINQHANAVLEAWYPGEEGGAAVAQTLSGKNNPAGRLPVTFYTGVDQLPHFEDYGMANRTYRYFTGKPLYPFGYGLSYTKFAYTDLSVSAQSVAAGQPVAADVTVKNGGQLAGDEVVQLYLKFPDVKGAARVALRGFQRIHLDPGASQKVHFELNPRDLGMVTEDGNPIIAQGDYTVSIGGGQPDTVAPVATGHFHVDGQYALPE
ncbi:glycoside hydrolase family 3 C-terminal domain-containing protein [Occallatibacter riparius]|uniref:Glycoside hydrolase family 3 C-terminal domain-containing protein n=1 Tax=Occallatibacter riparius TaxID=1002689 RepID=A0A9J7BNF5_9BACT|nr:glycoside hydrolase family 3 C-terminal domain-containing protein [Occallatibacter riparius]UWZ84151.1 glycoside hydrolase family 3 C-terminal domain-containing protein [Occallatibacter riparius]